MRISLTKKIKVELGVVAINSEASIPYHLHHVKSIMQGHFGFSEKRAFRQAAD